LPISNRETNMVNIDIPPTATATYLP
jgi:hypothetical protein